MEPDYIENEVNNVAKHISTRWRQLAINEQVPVGWPITV